MEAKSGTCTPRQTDDCWATNSGKVEGPLLGSGGHKETTEGERKGKETSTISIFARLESMTWGKFGNK